MLRLTTLGAVDLRDRRGRPVRDVLAQPKRVALLIHLAVEGRRTPVPRDRVLALFWPESDEARARNALSQALHHLRQSLGTAVIESHGANTVELQRTELWCDALAFAEALERGEGELALDLYRGEFCPALAVSGSSEVEQWLDGERRRLGRLAFDAARGLAGQRLEQGDTDAAARLARRALDMRPDDEGEVRSLLVLLERAGDAAGALRAYDDYERRLHALEATPDPATLRLLEGIRRRRGESAGEDPPGVAPPQIRPEPGARPVPRSGGRRRPALTYAIGLALVVVAGVTALTWRGWNRSAPAGRTVAVFPFAQRGSGALAFLREGMVDLLSAKLYGAAGIRALDPRAVLAAADSGPAPTPATLDRIARRLGATWYISGDVVEIGGRLQVNAALYAAGGPPQAVATSSVTGEEHALFQMVDDLAGRLLADLTQGRDTALTRLAAVTTHSLPALRAFLEGEQALRAGRDAEAAAAFQNATVLDTTFALAQYRLAMASTWVGAAWASTPGAPDPAAMAATAARNARHLAPLARDLVMAYHAYKEVRGDEAEQRYRALTASYPDNVEAWFMLAETLFHYGPLTGRSPMEGWAPFQRVLTLDPGNAHATIHLARLAAREGRQDALDSLARRYRALHSDAERTLEIRALQAGLRDDPVERGAVARAARAADELVAYSVLEAALLYAQNLDAAREVAPRFSPSVTKALTAPSGQRLVTGLGLMAGQWSRESVAGLIGTGVDDAWLLESQVLLAAEPLVPVPRARIAALRDSVLARPPSAPVGVPLLSRGAIVGSGDLRAYLAGLLSARLGDIAAAQRYDAQLAAVRDSGRSRWATMLSHALRAELARIRGDPRAALAELDRFEGMPAEGRNRLPAHWGVRERFLRAEMLRALRREGDAAELYDSFVSFYDGPFVPLALLRKAEIAERKGDRERARFYYQRFIGFWKDCDPEFRPLVAGAEAALARL
jgi:DNA-binding SARP family transcriptional activator/TolB-like protein